MESEWMRFFGALLTLCVAFSKYCGFFRNPHDRLRSFNVVLVALITVMILTASEIGSIACALFVPVSLNLQGQ